MALVRFRDGWDPGGDPNDSDGHGSEVDFWKSNVEHDGTNDDGRQGADDGNESQGSFDPSAMETGADPMEGVETQPKEEDLKEEDLKEEENESDTGQGDPDETLHRTENEVDGPDATRQASATAHVTEDTPMTGSDPMAHDQAPDGDPQAASFATEAAGDTQKDDEIETETSAEVEVEEPRKTDQDEDKMDTSPSAGQGIDDEQNDNGEQKDIPSPERNNTAPKQHHQRTRVPPGPVGPGFAGPELEDLSWMHEIDEDEFNDEDEFRRYECLRERNKILKRAGNLTIKEAVELSALEGKLAGRDNRRDNRRDPHNSGPKKFDFAQRGFTHDFLFEPEVENSLFVPEVPRTGSKRRRQAQEDQPEETSKRRKKYQAFVEDDEDKQSEFGEPDHQGSESSEDELQETNRKPKKHGKKKRVRARSAREVREQRREREAAKAKKRKPGEKTKSRRGGPLAGEDGFIATASAEARKKWRHSASERAAEILMNLMGTNAIKDRDEQPEGLLPTASKSRNKEKVLSDFIASMPKDVNKRKAGADKKEVRQASKNFGFGKVKPDGHGRWIFEGLRSTLYNHQLLGADFMVERECGIHEPYGGLLADSMGLGKTIEVLATMVGNPPDLSKGMPKTTLIVAPSGAIKQWMEEIDTHVTPGRFPKVLHYKRSKDLSMANLLDQDIIITSYYEVMRSYPFPEPDDIANMESGEALDWLREREDKTGDLHQIKFYRVVLDEAHTISNHRSRTSIACVRLDASYRWAITGTPIQNRLEELFPYFQFFRVPWTGSLQGFKKNFCNPNSEEHHLRIGYTLSFIMMRRTLKTRMFGRPIIDIPKAHETVERINFTKAERALYDTLEERFRMDINSYFLQGAARQNYGNFYIRLLRLRQATSHPYLLEEAIRETFSLEDLRRFEAQLARAGDEPAYEELGVWVRERMEQQSGSTGAANPGSTGFGKSSFGAKADFTAYLATLNEEQMLERCICRICWDMATDPQITDCKHVFCKQCIQDECSKAAAVGKMFAHCPSCSKEFKEVSPYTKLQARPAPPQEAEIDDEMEDRRSKKRNQAKKAWLNLSADILPSAKLVAAKAQILKWQQEAPEDKIIVFTQFNLTARIFQKICDAEGWSSALFLGDVDDKKRQAIRTQFREDPELKILIAGLKCGGQALNLTAANRVIIIDLWWNHGLEQQAFGRVFRIGQTKETHLVRYVVKNSIDERLRAMQDWKLSVVDGAMLDNGQVMKALSVEELAKLFGHLTADAKGNPYVAPDQTEEGDDTDMPYAAEPEPDPVGSTGRKSRKRKDGHRKHKSKKSKRSSKKKKESVGGNAGNPIVLSDDEDDDMADGGYVSDDAEGEVNEEVQGEEEVEEEVEGEADLEADGEVYEEAGGEVENGIEGEESGVWEILDGGDDEEEGEDEEE
ncbi:MAG: hypothetical protein M1823_004592 [Watsoniomyces obsoletus]|nr:MAG: hypothetical protein M1823_004592 [Watsoniomyces obsoletus]